MKKSNMKKTELRENNAVFLILRIVGVNMKKSNMKKTELRENNAVKNCFCCHIGCVILSVESRGSIPLCVILSAGISQFVAK